MGCGEDGEMDLDKEDDFAHTVDMFEPQSVVPWPTEAPYDRHAEARGLRVVRPVPAPMDPPPNGLQAPPPVASRQTSRASQQRELVGQPGVVLAGSGPPQRTETFAAVQIATTKAAVQARGDSVPPPSSSGGSGAINGGARSVVQAASPLSLQPPTQSFLQPGMPGEVAARNRSRQSANSANSANGYDARRSYGPPANMEDMYQKNRSEGRGSTLLMKTNDIKDRLRQMENMKATSPAKEKALSAAELRRKKVDD